jgi:hypothetical protein
MSAHLKIRRAFATLGGLAVLGAAPAAVAMPTHRPPNQQVKLVHEIRNATAKFHDIATAEAAGYVPFQDVNGVSCIADDGDMSGMGGMGKSMGGMGVHYVNPKLIADPAIDPTAPEALVYAPDRDGTLRLAAVEYLVDKAAWDAKHRSAPALVRGHKFAVTTAPNRYGLNTFYSQHVWAWKPNRSGQLAMWNPAVHCSWA